MMNDPQMQVHILGLCERAGKRFTLREVVALVMEERPELMTEFPEIWAVLIRRKRVRVWKIGEPNLYEVVNSSRH